MNKKGFTLIELLVVISIIGILIGLSIFGLQGARTSSRDARRKADLEQIRSALEIFKSDCDKYYVGASLPASLIGISGSPYGSSCLPANRYIEQMPVDAVPGRSYAYISDGTTYTLCASLEQYTGSAVVCGSLPASSCGTDGSNYVVKNP